MQLAPLFLLTLAFTMPLYAMLHAATLVLPGYSICLVLAGLLIGFSLRHHQKTWSDEAVLLVMLLGGLVLTIVGFAIAPLVVKILIVASLLFLQRRYIGLALN